MTMTKDDFLVAVKLMVNEDVSKRRFIHFKNGNSFDIVRFDKEEIVLSSWQKYDGSKINQSFPYDYLIENMVLGSDILKVTYFGAGYTSLPTITFETRQKQNFSQLVNYSMGLKLRKENIISWVMVILF